MENRQEKFLTIPEAAERLEVTVTYVHRLIRQNKIVRRRIGDGNHFEIDPKLRFRYCQKCRKYQIPLDDEYGLCKRCRKMIEAVGEVVVTCHTPDCGNKFVLEWWQHPQMAWCSACRKSAVYQCGGRFGDRNTLGGLYPLVSMEEMESKRAKTILSLCQRCKKDCKQYFVKGLTLFECYEFEEK